MQCATFTVFPIDETIVGESTPRAQACFEKGWKGLTLTRPSEYEHRALKAFCKAEIGEFFLSMIRIVDDECFALGHGEITEAELWVPTEEILNRVYDFLSTVKPRLLEFTVEQITPAMQEILDEVPNHLTIAYQTDDDRFDTGVLISMEEDDPRAVQLKLMA